MEKEIIKHLDLEWLINRMLNPATIIASRYQYSLSTEQQRDNMKAQGYTIWDLSFITKDDNYLYFLPINNYNFYRQLVDDVMDGLK